MMQNENIFIARQPILSSETKKYAYELLFRPGESNEASVSNNLHATSRVVSSAINHFNAQEITDNLPAFINIDHTILARNFLSMLPKDKYVFELLETKQINKTSLSKIENLPSLGYRFAIDDFDFSKEMTDLTQQGTKIA